jgi:WD40 repeat protein
VGTWRWCEALQATPTTSGRPASRWTAHTWSRAPRTRRRASGTLQTAAQRQVATLRGHDGVVRACQFSPDSRLIATCSWDKTIRVYFTQNFQVHIFPRFLLRFCVFSLPFCLKFFHSCFIIALWTPWLSILKKAENPSIYCS